MSAPSPHETTHPAETPPSPADRLMLVLSNVFRSPVVALVTVGSVLLAVVLLAAFGGYAAGVRERQHVAATAAATELTIQFSLAQQDVQAGAFDRAIQRLNFILERDPAYPGAAELLASVQQQQGIAPAPTPTLGLPTATPQPASRQTPPEELLAGIEAAQAAENWDEMVTLAVALRAQHPDFEPVTVDGLLFRGLRNSGVAHIERSPQELELGLFYLNEAAKIGVLDADAEQRALWAYIYINGMATWGLNWPRAVEAFDTLNLIAPYFHDVQARVRDSHLAFAQQLAAGGAPCDAQLEFEYLIELTGDEAYEEQALAAQDACLNPTPEGTPDPNATPDPDATPAPDATGDAGDGDDNVPPADEITSTPDG